MPEGLKLQIAILTTYGDPNNLAYALTQQSGYYAHIQGEARLIHSIPVPVQRPTGTLSHNTTPVAKTMTPPNRRKDRTELTKKRTIIKTKVTTFQTFLGKLDIDTSKAQELSLRLERAEKLLSEYDKVQSQIEELTDVDTEERTKFDDAFYATILLGRNTATRLSPSTSTEVAASATIDTTTHINSLLKLPDLKLPTFNGEYDQWITFRDTFEAIIDSNTSLSKVQKFYYLQSAVKGSAAQCFQSLSLSNENYDAAWTLLKSRFENKRLIVHHHIQALLELPVLTKESCTNLRKLIDDIQQNMIALTKLEQPVQSWDTLLIHLLTPKLDVKTKREWEFKREFSKLPTMKEFIDFLNKRCSILETLLPNQLKDTSSANTKSHKKSVSLTAQSPVEKQCPLCKNSHWLYACPSFRKLSSHERLREAKRLKIYLNCLRSHPERECTFGSCQRCKRRHNTMLHLDNNNPQTKSVDIEQGEVQNKKGEDDSAVRTSTTATNVALATTVMKSKYNEYRTELSCFVVDSITGTLPPDKFDICQFTIPKNILLADPRYNVPAKIDLLIGVALFYNLLQERRIDLGNNLPVLQETSLEQLERFWQLEEVTKSKPHTKEEQLCEDNFVSTHQRDQNGRFIVQLPLKSSISSLGKSQEIAERRLRSVERKLDKDATLKEAYVSFMQEYEQLNHMSEIGEAEDKDEHANYLPHHAVVKSTSSTTKVRVVFDASCKTTSALECQTNMPKISETIKRDFYVDDLITGGNDLSQLKILKEDIISLTFYTVDVSSYISGIRTKNQYSLLRSKKRQIQINSRTQSSKLTKRAILSIISQIFDPLGLIGPITVQSKLLLQDLWRLKVDWDDPVPIELHSKWSYFQDQIQYIPEMLISRHAFSKEYNTMEVHGFCDASEIAYALLLAELYRQVSQALTITPDSTYLWSDSTIALAWIKGEPSRWVQFVANRVTEIQQLTVRARWNHVSSKENPANIISRGMNSTNLRACRLWWNGPDWLKSKDWPPSKETIIISEDLLEERKSSKVFHSQVNDIDELFLRFSSLTKLKRVIGYCLRFKHNVLQPESKTKGPLTVAELENAMIILVSLAQYRFCYEELYTLLTRIEACLNSRPLCPLTDDGTDLAALTPAHFLIGVPLTSLPEVDVSDEPVNRLTRHQLLTQMRQHFWQRWSREYLTQLQQRHKWIEESKANIKIGTMVLLRNENTPPMHWRLGRVVAVHPGKDGLIRVIDVKTSNGVLQCSLPKICILPIET
ncbi:PREDICTED: uncharacterized protein LOC108765716 [Trachymyrmex cornetzi]|uniref:uncharacterized protein LOC108765716 n=1 Tax=Trachymyrmex cornetzi TaxID=471704 RepID=UPI00084F2328|nr:PREDICTED: uncharacterized protein LOC108765716 [Trachymyrmex cornetzi]